MMCNATTASMDLKKRNLNRPPSILVQCRNQEAKAKAKAKGKQKRKKERSKAHQLTKLAASCCQGDSG